MTPPADFLPPPPSRRGRAGAALLLAGLAGATTWVWATAESDAERAGAAITPTPRRVRAAPVTAGAPTSEVTLAGVARPVEVATVLARTTGVVAELTVEIGDRVEAGAPIASIVGAEAADDLRAARAQTAEAEETARLATLTRDRARELAATGAVSRAELDLAEADWQRAQAAVAARRAGAGRLSTLAGYQRVLAPRSGLVTRRLVDPGALAVAGQTGLVTLADTSALDVEIEVPQLLAAGVTRGLAVRVAASGAAAVPATLTRVAEVIDPATRTMRAEVRIAPSGVVPGAHVDVTLVAPRPTPPLVVPSRALAARPEGTQVAVVGGDGRIRWVRVTVLRDLGRDLELAPDPALSLGAQVVLAPPPTLAEGEAVEVVADAPMAP